MMVVYHFVFDLHNFYGYAINPISTGWWLFARSTAILFLLLVGISFELSKHRGVQRRWKRIGIVALCALIITVATYIWDPVTYIRFGILHCIAVSLALLTVLPKNNTLRFAIAIVVIGMGQLLLPSMRVAHELLLPVGIRPFIFPTLDYFPLLPWFGVVVLGTLIAKRLTVHMHTYEQANSRVVEILALPGRHALLLYMLHQPLILLLLQIAL